MLYTDLSYYTPSVHLHIRVDWPERLQAQKQVAFCSLSRPSISYFQSFRKAGLVL